MNRKVILEADEEVACPKCRHQFSLQEGISRHAIDHHAQEFERSLAAQVKLRSERESAQQLAALKTELAESTKALEVSKAQIEKVRTDSARAAREALDTELKSLQEINRARDEALEKARGSELALRRQLREAEDAKKNADLEFQRKLDGERRQIAERERVAATLDADRRVAQIKTQMEQAQREAADLKRKLEQGSQQVQGETLELGLGAMLREAFPLDRIEEVPKGMTGADLLQRVSSVSGQTCGTIIWEIKQTKAWQPAWLQKLKDDQRAVGAEIAVIVTATMPKDSAEPFMRQGDVWITSIAAARSVAEALRATLMEMHKLRQANAGRSEKMELVYSYVCSPQFAQRMKAVVDSVVAMRRELDDERRAYTRVWQKRERQIERLSGGMVAIVGDLQGIGEGTLPQLESIAALPALEDAALYEPSAHGKSH